jgi:hypothetical protein
MEVTQAWCVGVWVCGCGGERDVVGVWRGYGQGQGEGGAGQGAGGCSVGHELLQLLLACC